MKKLTLLLFFCFAFISFGDPLSEQDIIVKALAQNAELKIEKLSIEKSLLDITDASSRRLPNLNVSLGGSLDDSTGNLTGSSTLSQHIPGGGTISARIAQSSLKIRSPGSDLYNNSISAEIEQPLLKGAWGADPVQNTIKITFLNHKLSSLRNRVTVLSKISEARQYFWDLYGKSSLLDIAAKRSEQAGQILASQRARFNVGEASVLDTLSAALEYSASQQDYLNAQFQHESSLSALAAFLGESPENITIPDSVDLVIPEIPDPDEFIETARKVDPQIEIFKHMKELLTVQLQQSRNALLPTLNLQASVSRDASGLDMLQQNISRTNSSIGLILSYDLPRTETQSNISRIKLDQEIQEISLKSHEANLDHQLRELQRRWKLDKMKIQYAQMSSDLAQKQFDATVKGYELGTESRLSLIKAQNDLASARNSYVVSLVELKRLQIIIDEITGVTFDRFGVELK